MESVSEKTYLEENEYKFKANPGNLFCRISETGYSLWKI